MVSYCPYSVVDIPASLSFLVASLYAVCVITVVSSLYRLTFLHAIWLQAYTQCITDGVI